MTKCTSKVRNLPYQGQKSWNTALIPLVVRLLPLNASEHKLNQISVQFTVMLKTNINCCRISLPFIGHGWKNKEGMYKTFNKITYVLASAIAAVNPHYPYSRALASSIVTGTLSQHFFRQHLKTIIDFSENGGEISSFYTPNRLIKYYYDSH